MYLFYINEVAYCCKIEFIYFGYDFVIINYVRDLKNFFLRVFYRLYGQISGLVEIGNLGLNMIIVK